MPEAEFVPLLELLSPRVITLPPTTDSLERDHVSSACEPCSCGTRAERAVAVRDARLFRARLHDAFDDAALRLLRDLAADVLARELLLASCDLAAIARRIAEMAPVVCVRVAGADTGAIDGFAVVRDDSLAPGDAIVQVVGGAIDARLGVRLADVLDAQR